MPVDLVKTGSHRQKCSDKRKDAQAFAAAALEQRINHHDQNAEHGQDQFGQDADIVGGCDRIHFVFSETLIAASDFTALCTAALLLRTALTDGSIACIQ